MSTTGYKNHYVNTGSKQYRVCIHENGRVLCVEATYPRKLLNVNGPLAKRLVKMALDGEGAFK